MYAAPADPFPEVTQFIEETCKAHSLQLHTYHVISLRAAVKSFCTTVNDLTSSDSAPLYILVGVRRTDPYCSDCKEVQDGDADWQPPAFTRIQPLLDWTYPEIWEFLLTLNIPYCSLYSRGYTSLGGMSRTRPNPHLLRTDSYGHASELPDGEVNERAGRL